MTLLIERFSSSDKQILGKLYLYDNTNLVYTCYTLELPWKDNEKMVSCIPPKPGGRLSYKLKVVDSSPSFNYKHIDILDVENRTYIKIHRGNYRHEIKGCVLCGTDLVDLNNDGLKDVKSSKVALDKILELSNEDLTLLTITWVEPTI